MEKEREDRIAKALWEIMENEGTCDSYGGSEYRRCRPIVVDFIKKLIEACNTVPAQT